MRCGRVSSLVDRYVDGALPPRLAAEIEKHAASCPRCAAQIAAARRLLGALAAEPALKAPRGFTDR
ncbi:MAG TPA: zf-HC2 domain-containing protein, partial [Spirochaetia bacterium]